MQLQDELGKANTKNTTQAKAGVKVVFARGAWCLNVVCARV